jgi:hypothetical protein
MGVKACSETWLVQAGTLACGPRRDARAGSCQNAPAIASRIRFDYDTNAPTIMLAERMPDLILGQ